MSLLLAAHVIGVIVSNLNLQKDIATVSLTMRECFHLDLIISTIKLHVYLHYITISFLQTSRDVLGAISQNEKKHI